MDSLQVDNEPLIPLKRTTPKQLKKWTINNAKKPEGEEGSEKKNTAK